jgi:hypothetical protein
VDTRLRVDQPHDDLHTILPMIETTLEHVVGAEVVQLADRIVALDARHGVPRKDTNVWRARELGDDVVGQRLGEDRPDRVAGLGLQRQDGDPHVSRRRLLPPERGADAGAGQEARRGENRAAPPDPLGLGRGSRRRLEQVAAPWHRLDHRMGVVAERATEFVDALHEAVVGDGDARRDRLQEFVLGHHPARVRGEVTQHREDLRTQRDRCAAGIAHDLAPEIDATAR